MPCSNVPCLTKSTKWAQACDDSHVSMQDMLTPRERQAAQEVNALDFPVTIQLEDQMIPVTDLYGIDQGADNMAEGAPGCSSDWVMNDNAGTGDLAKWLHTGFTPRAGGTMHNAASCACATDLHSSCERDVWQVVQLLSVRSVHPVLLCMQAACRSLDIDI